MAKTWSQLAETEKIDELRRDIVKTMNRVNQIDRHSDVLQRGISEIAAKLDNLARRVAAVESAVSDKKPRQRAKKPKL